MTEKAQLIRAKTSSAVALKASREKAKAPASPPAKEVYSQSKPDPQVDSKVLCVECDSPIPLARLKAVKTDTCVRCMEELELLDKIQKVRTIEPETRGTIRHSMEFQVEGTEEVESIELHIRRGG